MELFDTHAHYNDEKFEIDRDEVIQNVYKSGVTRLVNAGYSLESSKKALQIANNYKWMYEFGFAAYYTRYKTKNR